MLDINKWVEDNYNDIVSWITGVTRGERQDLVNDFIQDIVIIFLGHPKSLQAIERGEARWFIVRIAMNQWRSKTSTFHYQYRLRYTDMVDKELQADEPYDPEQDLLLELLMISLDEMSRVSDYRYEYFMIMLYYSSGCNFSEVERRTKIPRTTVSSVYYRGMEKLRQIIKSNQTKLTNGTLQLNGDLTQYNFDRIDISRGGDQQTVSISDQLFRAKYFDFF